MTNVTTQRTIDEAGAEAVLDAAERHAREHGHRVVIAVVERTGELVALRRTPGAQIASSRVAVDKARTAAIFVRPSREIEQQVSGGRLGALALHGASALTGGIPLKIGDEVVGAIGTSGETPDEDEAISIAGAATEFSTTATKAVTYAGAKRAAEAVAAECTTARCRSRLRGRRRRRGARLPVAAREGPSGKRGRRHRQGPHGRDLPPPEQGLRGAGRGRPGIGAAPGAGGAASGRHPARPR